MGMTRLIIYFASLSLFAACASAPRSEEPASPPTEPASGPAAKPVRTVDFPTLTRTLQLDRAIQELGYEEKRFDPCELGIGPAGHQQCGTYFLAVIHFQLQCRDVDGTVEIYNTEPIRAKNVRWTLGRIQGKTETDHEGYGQVIAVAPASQRQQKLRITVGNDFLIVSAEQAKRLVTPPDWCPRR